MCVAAVVLTACGKVGGRSFDGVAPQSPPTAPPPAAPTNTAPVANAGPDQNIALPTDSVTLAGSATDDSLPTSVITYTWEYVSGPLGPNSSPGVVVSNANAATATVRFVGGVGDYVFNLRASDGALTGTDVLHVTVNPNALLYPGPTFAGWATATPADESMLAPKLDEARDYSQTLSLGTEESGVIVRHGRVVYQWGDPNRRYEMKSTTKSIGGLAFLLALDSGTLTLNDRAIDKLPVFGTAPAVDTSLVTTGSLNDITLRQLATHTSGLSKSDVASSLQLLTTPGTTWSYSDQALNWLADTLTHTYAQDMNVYLRANVFTTLDILPADLTWRADFYRPAPLDVNGTPVTRREFASGINASVNAMARVGYLMLRKGVWRNTQILSNAIVEQAHTPVPEIASLTNADPAEYPDATSIYGILWWSNANGHLAGVPRDTYWAWGLHDTLIIVIPSLDLVIARAGVRGWRVVDETWNGEYSFLEPFIAPIVESVTP
jgi:CubicO group peptidase (beta-lactamase class C family)